MTYLTCAPTKVECGADPLPCLGGAAPVEAPLAPEGRRNMVRAQAARETQLHHWRGGCSSSSCLRAGLWSGSSFSVAVKGVYRKEIKWGWGSVFFSSSLAVILVAWHTFENMFSVILLCKVRKRLLSSLNSQDQEEAKDQVVLSLSFFFFFLYKWLLILDVSISEGLAVLLWFSPREIQKGEGKGSHPRQPGASRHDTSIWGLSWSPTLWPAWGYQTWPTILHHPQVPWSSCEAELCIRIHPEGFDLSWYKRRAVWLQVSEGTAAQQMLKSVGKIYGTQFVDAVGQAFPNCGLWPDGGLNQGPCWML